MEFYAIANNEQNESVVIGGLPKGSRIEALRSAQEYCKKIGLAFKELRPVKGTKKQPSTLTKTIENKRGRKVYWSF